MSYDKPLIQKETAHNFRFVQVLEIGEFVKMKSYRGYNNYGKRKVRCLIDLHKPYTKVCDFYFVGDYDALTSILELKKTYKFTFLLTIINWIDKFNNEIKARVEFHVGGVTPVNISDIYTELTDITQYDCPPEEHPEIKKRLEERLEGRLIYNNYKNK